MARVLLTSEKAASKPPAGMGRTKYQCDCYLATGRKEKADALKAFG